MGANSNAQKTHHVGMEKVESGGLALEKLASDFHLRWTCSTCLHCHLAPVVNATMHLTKVALQAEKKGFMKEQHS